MCELSGMVLDGQLMQDICDRQPPSHLHERISIDCLAIIVIINTSVQYGPSSVLFEPFLYATYVHHPDTDLNYHHEHSVHHVHILDLESCDKKLECFPRLRTTI